MRNVLDLLFIMMVYVCLGILDAGWWGVLIVVAIIAAIFGAGYLAH